jgi:hypothetical protein
MPYKNKADRDYKAEQQYDGRPDVKKKRALRNAARAKMIAAGKAAKGDGKDIDHPTPKLVWNLKRLRFGLVRQAQTLAYASGS